MKIYNDKTTPGYISEKNETQGRVSKTPKSGADKTVQIPLAADDLELTSQKVSVMNSVREANIGNAPSVEFDAGEVPMMQQKLSFVSSYILNNPLEALSAQANLNADTVAALLS